MKFTLFSTFGCLAAGVGLVSPRTDGLATATNIGIAIKKFRNTANLRLCMGTGHIARDDWLSLHPSMLRLLCRCAMSGRFFAIVFGFRTDGLELGRKTSRNHDYLGFEARLG